MSISASRFDTSVLRFSCLHLRCATLYKKHLWSVDCSANCPGCFSPPLASLPSVECGLLYLQFRLLLPTSVPSYRLARFCLPWTPCTFSVGIAFILVTRVPTVCRTRSAPTSPMWHVWVCHCSTLSATILTLVPYCYLWCPAVAASRDIHKHEFATSFRPLHAPFVTRFAGHTYCLLSFLSAL